MKKALLIVLSVILFSCSNNLEQGISFTDDFDASNYAVDNSYTEISLNQTWQFAEYSKINSGKAKLYQATENRKNITVAVNAGHGTSGANLIKTYSHPDKTPKITGGTNNQGAVESLAISAGMTFDCGLSEADANLRVALILRKLLLDGGYDVLMIREEQDVQLDNIARTVISNNNADIHISIHFDGDSKKTDKGCFYCGIPEELKFLENVNNHYAQSETLGTLLINQLRERNVPIYSTGRVETDLTQTSYSTIPTVDIELGNQCTVPNTNLLEARAFGIFKGIEKYFD